MSVGVGAVLLGVPGRHNPRPAKAWQLVSTGHSLWMPLHAAPILAGWHPVAGLQVSHCGTHGGAFECSHMPVAGLHASVVHGLPSMSGHCFGCGKHSAMATGG